MVEREKEREVMPSPLECTIFSSLDNFVILSKKSVSMFSYSGVAAYGTGGAGSASSKT